MANFRNRWQLIQIKKKNYTPTIQKINGERKYFAHICRVLGVYLEVSSFIFVHCHVSSLFGHICSPFCFTIYTISPLSCLKYWFLFKQSNKINSVRSKSGCEQERGGGGVSEQNLHFRRSQWCKKGLLACACPGRSGSTVMEGSHHYHQRDISSLRFFGSQLWSLDRRWKQETAWIQQFSVDR